MSPGLNLLDVNLHSYTFHNQVNLEHHQICLLEALKNFFPFIRWTQMCRMCSLEKLDSTGHHVDHLFRSISDSGILKKIF